MAAQTTGADLFSNIIDIDTEQDGQQNTTLTNPSCQVKKFENADSHFTQVIDEATRFLIVQEVHLGLDGA